MRNKYFLLPTILIVLAGTLFCSCSDSSKTTGGGKLQPVVVVDCTIPGNEQKPECVQKCIQDPTLAWCTPAQPTAKFTCPVDGSFKAVDPFTGKELVFPDGPATIDAASGDNTYFTTAYTEGDLKMLLYNVGEELRMLTAIGTPMTDLDSTITSADVFHLDGKYYVVVGTANSLQILPFTNKVGDSPLLEPDGLTTFENIGGIAQVAVASSIDLSGSSGAKSLPPGMLVSVNVPPDGVVKDASAGNLTFVYLLSADGDIWRIKIAHLLNGGCVERLYSAANNLDANDRKMAAKRFAVAGQYVVINSATSDLPPLDGPSTASWVVYEGALIQSRTSHKLITNDFYWLVNHLANPRDSTEKLSMLNLLSASGGSLTDIQTDSGTKRYHITDLMLRGNMLYATAHQYDMSVFPNSSPDVEITDNMELVWNSSRSGESAKTDRAVDYISKASSNILVIDLERPTTVNAYILASPEAPHALANVSLPIYTKLSFGNGKLFVVGENKYFASGDIASPNNLTPVRMQAPPASTLTPWSSSFDPVSAKIFTSFIYANEKIGQDGQNVVGVQ